MNAGPPAVRGEVILIGAGPGDPKLLTRAGAEWLGQADVVVYDQLIDLRLLSLARPEAELIAAGKSKGRCLLSQEEINALLVSKAQQGLRVVRLKGGDPFVFGRGAEEAEHLREHGVAFRIVPGITAGLGATAYAGIPVTHRASASAVAFVTGHHDPLAPPTENGRPRVDWAAIARFPGTIVVYMGLSRLEAISQVLMSHGLAASTPAALVASGTLPSQRRIVGTLASIPQQVAELGIVSPALLVIGEVVHHADDLDWFETGPLMGQAIVVTRPASEDDHSAADLEALGAEVLPAPMIEILPVADTQPIDATINRLATFDWVAFTSPNGVRHLLDRVFAIGKDVRAFATCRLAAIGPATAEALAGYHLKADLVPESHRSEALAEALLRVAKGQSVLLARADRGRPVLREMLQEHTRIEELTVYRNVDVAEMPRQVVNRIESGTVHWVVVTSSAIVERLHALLSPKGRGQIGSTVRLASISPVTTATARKFGWDVAVEAHEHDWIGLTSALVAFVNAERSADPGNPREKKPRPHPDKA